MTQHTCLWHLAEKPHSFSNKQLPTKTDVAIIGGGYTGLSAALYLAKNGAQVTLLEAQTMGYGASSRNGGQALAGLHHNFTAMIEHHGLVRAKEMFSAAENAIATVEQIINEESINCHYTRNGNIAAASKPSHADELLKEQELLAREANHPTTWVDKKDAASELGSGIYHGLLVDPRSGILQPAEYVYGLATAAARAGADLHENTKVTTIEKINLENGTRFKIKTERGDILAKEVMVATNAYSGDVHSYFKRRVIPVTDNIIATEPLSEDLIKTLIPNKRAVYNTKNLGCYFRYSPDNRLVFGGEGTLFSASPQKNITALKMGMIKIFPQLENSKIDYYWSGVLSATIDNNPHAGRVDGVWYSMCYAGHGVTMATYLGEQTAKAILGREYFNPFENLAFRNVPLFNGNPWFMPFGTLWYRILDLIG